MFYTPLINKALKICFEAHKAQVDKAGVPYVFHPIHLAEQFDSETRIVCALLHDVVEDWGKIYDKDFFAHNFPPHICKVLFLLTRRENQEYRQYIYELSKDDDAKAIKIADLKHNMDISRFGVDKEWFLTDYSKNLELVHTRYSPALEYLLGNNPEYAKAYERKTE